MVTSDIIIVNKAQDASRLSDLSMVMPYIIAAIKDGSGVLPEEIADLFKITMDTYNGKNRGVVEWA